MSDTVSVPQAERDRLRALAEKARAANESGTWYHAAFLTDVLFNEDDAELFAACTPAVVLSLLDALDAGDRDAVRLDFLADKVLRVSSNDDDEWEIALYSDAEHQDERIITAGPTFRDAIDAAAHPEPGASRE